MQSMGDGGKKREEKRPSLLGRKRSICSGPELGEIVPLKLTTTEGWQDSSEDSKCGSDKAGEASRPETTEGPEGNVKKLGLHSKSTQEALKTLR